MPAEGAMQTEVEAPVTEPLSFRNVTRRYPRVTALEGIDLAVRQDELMAVVGPSGCGKSTLLELVAGLQEPDAGTVTLLGATDAAGRRATCAYMPQRDLLLPWRDALANAALALECQGVPRAEARARAVPLFERFGLAEFERARPSELSGGMRQRVAFLRTLLPGRPVLLLDEPFGALDSITRASMQRWLADALEQEPRTVLLVTHDTEEAIFLADRLVVLSPRPGRVVAEIPVGLPRPRDVTSPEFTTVKRTAVASLDSVDDLTLASPVETFDALVDDWSLLWDNAKSTLAEVLLGLVAAVLVGGCLGIAMHLFRPLRDAAYPLLVASQAVPIVVLAPIFVLLFDFGMRPTIAIVALICFFPITVNLLDGLRSVEPDLLKLMRSMGASRLRTLRSVELPASLPSLFTGLKVAATVSVIGAVFGEWACGQEGLGRLVLNANNQLQTGRLYAGTVLLSAMAIALFLLAALLERLMCPWNRKDKPV